MRSAIDGKDRNDFRYTSGLSWQLKHVLQRGTAKVEDGFGVAQCPAFATQQVKKVQSSSAADSGSKRRKNMTELKSTKFEHQGPQRR